MLSLLASWFICFQTIAEAAKLLPGIVGLENGTIKWSDPPPGWEGLCAKVTTVFDVPVCLTFDAWYNGGGCSDKTKVNHVVQVFYQLLDNNADGVVDDPDVVNELVNNGYLLVVPLTENDDADCDFLASIGAQYQFTGLYEAVVHSCDVPNHRGASATDRSTWSDAFDLDGKDCDRDRDATVEEILHLITGAAASIYPSKWGANYQSEAGTAIQNSNGNCGWGYSRDWINPSSNKCEGQYAYDDRTCDSACIVVEGIYWAIISYIGGLYTTDRAQAIDNEWLMATPDSSMTVIPKGVSNAISLELGSPALYSLVSDTSSEGHKWLPEIMPDGRYFAFDDAAAVIANGVFNNDTIVWDDIRDGGMPLTIPLVMPFVIFLMSLSLTI